MELQLASCLEAHSQCAFGHANSLTPAPPREPALSVTNLAALKETGQRRRLTAAVSAVRGQDAEWKVEVT